MKTKEKKDLKEKSITELKQLLLDAKEILFTMRLDKVQYKTKNMRGVFNKRKDIAKIMTQIREKETV
ncbi:hypothetical protein LBMAG33_6710 [Candidatus Levyibacteriota bacterium]|nr:50S ribosomal protein L29 [Candidatus Levybacteria bacterium]MSU25727.1 50S ribosomal protein L29 [Candidatus Levybacteria bacterium]GDX62361.1 hypothetical protein LBMAG33_6710 [Candidatus Levybacteria bacterium]